VGSKACPIFPARLGKIQNDANQLIVARPRLRNMYAVGWRADSLNGLLRKRCQIDQAMRAQMAQSAPAFTAGGV
jgi:hypothetical protein